MIAQAALGGTQREVVLDTIAGKNFRRSIITMNWQGHGDRSLGILQSGTIVFRDFEVVGHHVKLLACHVKGGVIVNLHARRIRKSRRRAMGDHMPTAFCVRIYLVNPGTALRCSSPTE